MKRDKEELIKRCNSSVETIKSTLSLLEKENDQYTKYDYAAIIAVKFRSLFCFVSGTKPLIKRCEFWENLLFPCSDLWEPLNLFSSFTQGSIMVSIKENEAKSSFIEREDIVNQNKIPQTLVKTSIWLDEVVADFKSVNIPPLTRRDIIRAVADKDGAHVDDEDEKFVQNIENAKLFEASFNDNGEIKKIFIDAKDFLIKNIIVMTKEFIWSYEYTLKSLPQIIGPTKNYYYLQNYLFDKRNAFRIVGANYPVNPYNSNSFYICDCYKIFPSKYRIKFRGKYFYVDILDFRDSTIKEFLKKDLGYGKTDWNI